MNNPNISSDENEADQISTVATAALAESSIADARDIRAQRRGRVLIRTVAATFITRLLTLITPLITTPLALNYLGQERYGLWMTVTSLVGMLAFCDLGLGSGMMTMLSSAYGHNDAISIRRLVSSAYAVLIAVSAVAIGLFLLVRTYIPWMRLFNVHNIESTEIAAVVSTCAIVFLLNIPGSLIQRIQLTVQEGYQSQIWQCLASLLSLLCIVAVLKYKAGFIALLLGALAVPLVISILNTFVFFQVLHPEFKPAATLLERKTTSLMMQTGFAFFVIAILNTVAISSDNLILAQLADLQAVATYSVPYKIVSLLPMMITMVCIPLWAANGEALANGDSEWIIKTAKKAILLGVLACASLGAVLVIIGPAILHLWVPKLGTSSRWLWAGLAFNGVMIAVCSPLFMILNAAKETKRQIAILIPFLVLSLVLKGVAVWSVGIVGLPWISGAIYLCYLFPLLVRETKRSVQAENRHKLRMY
jgi:O-antigen/teichoic acid export membrane protein